MAELKKELAEREQDLVTYRTELEHANKKLEGLVHRLSHELLQLTRLQHVLVPTELPHISGFDLSSKFLPGTKSGGDYFDIFEHEDRMRFGIILANSSGYAASALFLSVLLKLTGQMEARKSRHSDEIMAQLLTELKSHFSAQDQAHVFYAIVDRRTFEMEYVCCGSHILLHQNHQTGRLTRLDSEKQPLSQKSEGPFQRRTVSLGPKDRLVFCSPGCVKAANGQAEIFGEERLYRAVLECVRGSVHELRNEIFFQLQKFTKTSEPAADQTALVLEVKDRVIRLTR